jgi:hypothetical protein
MRIPVHYRGLAKKGVRPSPHEKRRDVNKTYPSQAIVATVTSHANRFCALDHRRELGFVLSFIDLPTVLPTDCALDL